jgi:predicted GNAT family acetyltransferase
VVSLEHTVVEPAFRGRGIAKHLVAHAVDWARENGVKLKPACSFAVAEFAKHPEYADVLAP